MAPQREAASKLTKRLLLTPALLTRVLLGALLFAPGCGSDNSDNAQAPGLSHLQVPLPADTPVILIMVDTLSATHLAAYGYELDTTPVLDELFSDASLFLSNSTQCNSTSPSITSILTGLYPKTHRNRLPVSLPGFEASGAKDGEVRTMAEWLQSQGYSTMAVVSHPSWSSKPDSTLIKQGWDAFSAIPQRPTEAASQSEQDTSIDSVGDLASHRIAQANASYTNERTFELLDRYEQEQSESGGAEPLFLWVHYFDPHTDLNPVTYNPPTGYRDRFLAHHLESAGLSKHFEALSKRQPLERIEYILDQSEGTAGSLSNANGKALYDAEINYCDTEIGRLIERLKAMELWDRAVVIFMADHGENLNDRPGEKSQRFTHQRLFEPVARTPLAIRLPSQGLSDNGQRITALSQNIDVLPTLRELFGSAPVESLEGASLLGLMKSEVNYVHDFTFMESSDNVERAVRSANWKFISSGPGKREYLFNWPDDPTELTNQLTEPLASQAAQSLNQQLQNFRPPQLMHFEITPQPKAWRAHIEVVFGDTQILSARDARGQDIGAIKRHGRRFSWTEAIREAQTITLELSNDNPPVEVRLRKNRAALPLDRMFLGPQGLSETAAFPLLSPVPDGVDSSDSVALQIQDDTQKRQLEITWTANSKSSQRELEIGFERPNYKALLEVESTEHCSVEKRKTGGLLLRCARGQTASARLNYTEESEDMIFLAREDQRWLPAEELRIDNQTYSAEASEFLIPWPADPRLNAVIYLPVSRELPPGSIALWREGQAQVQIDASKLSAEKAEELRRLGYLGDD